jgi:predicted phage terminase large subunit-like protein
MEASPELLNTRNNELTTWHDLTSEKVASFGRENFLSFAKYTMPEFKINWHHRLIARYLERFVKGEITRLMIFLQPQIGKSQMVSRHLPAYIFGKDPDHNIIAASYGWQFTAQFNRDVQRIIDSEKYRALFPDVKLSDGRDSNWARNTEVFEIVNRKGKYHSVGVGGSLTGKTANTFIIDDPVKNMKEASSETFRQHQFDWFMSTARTRLKDAADGTPARILLTMTRWHEDDLAGRLLKLAKDDPQADQWTVLSFPAIREDDSNDEDPRKIGEPLWPSVFSLEDMGKIKAASRRVWSSLYQQRPSPEEGTLIKRGWWKYYREAPATSAFDQIIQSWDLTFKDGPQTDFVVGQVWGKIGANKYLLDQVRARLTFTETIMAIMTLTAKWPAAHAKLVEEAANGAAMIDTLRNKIPGMIPIRPRGAKLARAQAVTPSIEAGNVILPDPSIAPWIHDYVEEWAVFPNGAHDDQIDSTSQALTRLNEGMPTDWAPISFTGPSKWR